MKGVRNTVRVGALREAMLVAAQVSRVDSQLVLYTSFRGDYSDSPRAIFERLRDERPDLDHTWVVGSDAVAAQLPGGPRSVAYGSFEHLRAIGRARLIVSNNNLPAAYVKKPGSFYLQTWHGTPLKKIGCHRDGFDTTSHRVRARVRSACQSWDCLLSPSPTVSEIFRSAFRYRGRILESGYPRNDLLHAADAGECAAAVRRALGLPDDKRLVLYAPTFDDDVAAGRRPFSTAMDPGVFERELGDTHILLMRLHPRLRSLAGTFAGPACVDVTAHPDMRELLLVADVLITDYSSCFFDFVATGKPVVFLMPDRERYERELRGLYLDIDAQPLPGPVVTSEAEAIEVIRDEAWWPSDDVRDFVATYCLRDDGRATARVLDEVVLPLLAPRKLPQRDFVEAA